MHPIFSLLTEFSNRLDPRMRRVLLVSASAGLVLFARTTVTALRDGSIPDVVAGAILMALFAVAAAVASTRRPAA
jgi:ABC-type glucose/galactose transport system permease subunit